MSTPLCAVLLIDDEQPVRDAIADLLDFEGVRVFSAGTGDAGVRLFRERAGEIRLVLLDLSMPGLSGEETFAALKKISAGVHVVLTSGVSQAEAESRFAGQGVAGFIQKPYDPETLISVVRRYLG